jgi:hypothetical protein
MEATMFKTTRIATLFLAATIGMAALAAAPRAQAEEMGSTCSDCATYKGKYRITNKAMFEIEYQYRWGKHEDWRTVVLSSGAHKTHSYYLGTDKHEAVPTPYVRFRKTTGTWSGSHEMDFYAVIADPGYGGSKGKTKAKRYALTYTGDFQQIHLEEE